MPDNTLTEEEKKQVERIVKRWINYSAKWALLIMVIMPVIVFLILQTGTPLDQGTDILLLLIHISAMTLISLWALKKFGQRLSLSERELLARVPIASLSETEKQTVANLLKACAINPQKELLRASAKTDDETLLRAATHTDNTPQDQLLRPSQDTK